VSHLIQARKVFDIEVAALKKVRAQLDRSFDRAIELIVQVLEARGKIVVVGIGKSGNVGHKISATLTSTGSTSVVLNSVDALHGDLGIVNDGDLILALSYSGESEELLNLLPALKRFLVKIIAVTGDIKSSLALHSDLALNVRVPKEACPFNLAPTASTTAMLVMGDALAMAVLQARGFKQSDFARYHPSGAIGRAMLLRVGDIMRTGERNAVAREDVTVKEALLVMTRAKSGSLCVVDARGKLAGVFTDGDFRRHMSNGRGHPFPPAKKRHDEEPDCHIPRCSCGRSLEDFQRTKHRRLDRGERKARAGRPGGLAGFAEAEDYVKGLRAAVDRFVCPGAEGPRCENLG
jgi:arabinose-5-phosphate isomerase